MTLAEQAVAYAATGAEVFPLNPDKTPATRNGMKDGTSDVDNVRQMFGPTHIIGCRVPARYVLLDVDPRHGGHDVWNALVEAYGPIAIGRQHHSGRNDGGFHAWFLHPGGDLHIRKLTEWAKANGVAHRIETDNGRERWTCGIDILHHDHRYTILPPSPHPDTGMPYAWDSEGEVGPMPGFLAALLEPPEPPAAPPRPTLTAAPDSDSIADWYTATAHWADILTGWTVVAGDGEHDGSKWRHPAATAAWSATIKYGCLFVYTESTVFEPTSPSDVNGYTKFKAYAEMHHGGGMSAAAKAARELRDGPPATPPPRVAFNPAPPVTYTPPEPGEQWQEPTALGIDRNLPPFPLHALPDWIANQCRQAAEEMQLTPDLAAQLAITALSVVTAGRVEIRVRGPWTEPTNLYGVTALPPSAGKSPTFGMMLGPLDRWEEALIESSQKDIADRQIARQVREHDRDKHIKQGDATAAMAISDELLELPEIRTPRLLADDVTPEKLAVLLGEQGGRLAVISTEGGLFGMMVGRYSDKANLDVYLGSWSRDKIARDRMVGPPVIVRRPHLTIGLTVQPQVLQELADTPELAGRGLTARFMYSIPAETVGQRDRLRASTYDDTIADTYSRRLVGLAHELDARVPVVTVDPIQLTLSPDALQAFLTWQQAHEDELGEYGELRHMAEWLSKCESSTIRLAGVIHLANLDDDGSPISAETMRAAMSVGDYWKAHAASAFDLMGADPLFDGARKMVDWLATRDAETITVRDMQQSHKRIYPRVADIVDVVDLMVEKGWLRPLFESDIPLRLMVGKRGKSSPEFAISPAVRTVRIGVGSNLMNLMDLNPLTQSDIATTQGEDERTSTVLMDLNPLTQSDIATTQGGRVEDEHPDESGPQLYSWTSTHHSERSNVTEGGGVEVHEAHEPKGNIESTYLLSEGLEARPPKRRSHGPQPIESPEPVDNSDDPLGLF